MDLNKEYNELIDKRKKVVSEICDLIEEENVKKYIELCKENVILKSSISNLYKKIIMNQYEKCNHVYVTCGYTTDGDYDSSTIAYRGCIKCGLTTEAYNNEYFNNIMNEFFKKHSLEYDVDRMPGKRIARYIDLDTARMLYTSIIKDYPDIDDDELVNIFIERLNYKNNHDSKSFVLKK